jgi:putative redox protein
MIKELYMYASAAWQGGLSFTGTARSGFEVKLDAGASAGGAGEGFRPLEMFGVGLAACTGMDVISILQKKRQEVTDFAVLVDVDQAAEHPYVYTAIRIHYVVTGREVDPAAVERAIELSATKYCPASAMLEKAAPITHSYEIIPV